MYSHYGWGVYLFTLSALCGTALCFSQPAD